MLAIIQARMSSTRLPGKVLLPLAGIPMLGRVHARLARASGLSCILVATSQTASDDALADYCHRHAIPCQRGSLDDVAGRLLTCAQMQGATAFLRISGDSPLIDPMIVDQAIALHAAHNADLTTNVQTRSFPKGQSVEIIRTAALASAFPLFRDAQDHEHVTRYFYAHPGQFRIHNMTCDEPWGAIQLSVDTQADADAIAAILAQAGEQVTWRQAVALRLAADHQRSDLG